MSICGIVVIGRNEGERLRACFESILGKDAGEVQRISVFGVGALVVYVDSGSTDGSVNLARSFGTELIELDLSRPFSAARARNEGYARLLERVPEIRYVQFVDGDCEVANNWLNAALSFLENHSDYAVVCGRRRERFPEKSVYNQICDIEWNTPVGDPDSCGGDAMIRVSAFQNVGCFNSDVVAGEEPELCLRLRRAGWKIRRLDAEMTTHDAAMTRFGQWWKRSVRTGYGMAVGAVMHGRTPERHWVKEVRSNWFWGIWVPILAFALAWPTRGISLTLMTGYPMLAWRVFGHMRRRGFSAADARLYAWFCVLGKFPQVLGQLRFLRDGSSTRPHEIIEYKDITVVPPV